MKKIKKNILSIIALVLLTGILSSCEESNNELSEVTYLPKFTLNGESSVTLDCGITTYTDEGVIVTEGNSVIDHETVISGLYFGASSFDGPDNYSVAYSATNVNGIPGSAFVDVTWPACNGDFITSISGTYKATVTRGGALDDDFIDMSPIFIRETADGSYQLSHAMGGYYDYGFGYGPDFSCQGAVITGDISSNSFSATQAVFPVWGNTGDISNFSIDPTTKVITYISQGDFGNSEFGVTLTQIEL